MGRTEVKNKNTVLPHNHGRMLCKAGAQEPGFAKLSLTRA